MSDKPILIYFDGSEGAAKAIACAGELLGERQALVVHSWSGLSQLLLRSDLEGWTGTMVEAAKEIDAADRERAAEIATRGAELATKAGFAARPLVAKEHGNTWRTLANCAEEHEVSAVVVGARGGSMLGKLLLGSVSNGLVNHPPAPVLVVPEAAGRQSEGPLVFCDDGSEPARHAIDVAAALLMTRRPAVTVNAYRSWSAHVATYVPIVSGEAMGMAKELDEAADKEADGLAEESRALVEEKGMPCRGISVHTEGPIWQALLGVADEQDAACVVVGSHGKTGISAALGSVSHGVVHHSRRPTLLVPPA